MLARRFCTVAGLLLSVACASAPDPDSDAAPLSVSRQADVITATELTDPALGSANLYEAVRRLRPRFLSSRGPSSIANPSAGTVHVSVDGGPLSAVSVLASFLPNTIAEVRYLNAGDATQRFGANANGGGVLLVKSR